MDRCQQLALADAGPRVRALARPSARCSMAAFPMRRLRRNALAGAPSRTLRALAHVPHCSAEFQSGLGSAAISSRFGPSTARQAVPGRGRLIDQMIGFGGDCRPSSRAGCDTRSRTDSALRVLLKRQRPDTLAPTVARPRTTRAHQPAPENPAQKHTNGGRSRRPPAEKGKERT